MDMCRLFRGKKNKTNRSERLTQKEIVSQIDALIPGETASYRLKEGNGSSFATVEYSTGYPWTGKKYLLSTRTTTESDWTVRGEQVHTTYEAREIAHWLIEHKARRRLHMRTIPPNKTRYRTAVSSQ